MIMARVVLLLFSLLETSVGAYMRVRVGEPQMMAPKPKKPKPDHRVWLPKRTSPFGREVDVAHQLVSRAAATVGKASSTQVANIAVQALVCDGLASEFAGDNVIASESASTLQACDAAAQQAVLELVNEIGQTTPCVNSFDPPYPAAVKSTELSADTLGAAIDRGAARGLGPRTWVLSPVTDDAQPAISLALLEHGQPVMCAVALPNMPRTSMSGEKLLRMTVSFDGQSGAVRPPDGTILWAEEHIGAYERSIGGEHGTDVVLRADRSLLGQRDIATGRCEAEDLDLTETTRCEAAASERAAALAAKLGMSAPPLSAGGPFAYGLVARGEAQTYFELPDAADGFDGHVWAHAAGCLLVQEAGGRVTDTAGNALDFSASREGITLPQHVVGILATNGDVHARVVRELGLASIEKAAA